MPELSQEDFVAWKKIADPRHRSKKRLYNLALYLFQQYVKVMNRWVGGNFITPPQHAELDLLSTFAQEALDLRIEELQGIAVLAPDLSMARNVIDMNRAMSLVEADYTVRYNGKYFILIGTKA